MRRICCISQVDEVGPPFDWPAVYASFYPIVLAFRVERWFVIGNVGGLVRGANCSSPGAPTLKGRLVPVDAQMKECLDGDELPWLIVSPVVARKSDIFGVGVYKKLIGQEGEHEVRIFTERGCVFWIRPPGFERCKRKSRWCEQVDSMIAQRSIPRGVEVPPWIPKGRG